MRIHRHRRRAQKNDIPAFNVNEKITAEEVRVIDEQGEMRGVLSIKEALKLAEDAGLDLIEVSPKANPPVCKILDSGSYKYQKEKEMKKQRAQSKQTEIKGIRLSLKIGKNDMDVRLKQALKFLEKGSKVRLEMILRGREKAHAERGREVMMSFIEAVRETYDVKIESPIKTQHGRMNTIIARVK